MSRDDSMFDRWSRRKRAVAEAEAEDAAKVAPAPTPTPEVETESLCESELLEKLGLPDPDTLQKGDDFAAFMRAGVPDFLRKRALRKLWLSNPDLANLDGLLDYGGDYTDAALVPKVMNTLYQVGKGMLREKVEPPQPPVSAVAEIDAVQMDQPEAVTLQDAPGDACDENDTGAAVDEVADEFGPENQIKVDPEHTETELENVVYAPRRMAFTDS